MALPAGGIGPVLVDQVERAGAVPDGFDTPLRREAVSSGGGASAQLAFAVVRGRSVLVNNSKTLYIAPSTAVRYSSP
jgi:hypothetical protein